MKQIFSFLFFSFLLSSIPLHAQGQTVSVDTVYIQILVDSCRNLPAKDAIKLGENTLALIEMSFPVSDSKTKTCLKFSKTTLLRIIGNAYKDLFDLLNALDYYQQCLKTAKDINDKTNQGGALLNMGVVYQELHEYQKALDYLNQSLEIFEKTNNKRGLAYCFQSFGGVYSSLLQDSLALAFYDESIYMFMEIADKNNTAYQLNNMANIYKRQKKYDEATDNYEFSLKMFRETGDSMGVAISMAGIGDIYENSKGDLKMAEKYYLRSLANADMELKKEILNTLKDLYNRQGRYKEAFKIYDEYVLIKDSIASQHNAREIMRRDMQTDFEDKQAKLQAEKEKEAIRAAEEHKRQQLIIWSVGGGLLLVAVFSIFIFNRWRITQKQKKIIEVQKVEVEKQKEIVDEQKKIVEEKNKDITDSISYAKRIQRAMLPHRSDVWDAFPQSFVLFKPKDIVSGDFYFFYKSPERSVIAVADCTGHGVPGAFMSMLGTEKLHDAAHQTTNPGEILQLVNRGVKKSLHQSEEEDATRDGMDIALCSYNKEMNMLEYSGANRPIWIIRNEKNNELFEIKATKVAIGGFTPDEQEFAVHTIDLKPGDTIYISSDGYGDQFSAGGKKLMTKKFKEILVSIQDKSMKEQKEFLESFIENWKAGAEQVDDILVIGIRV